MRYFFRVEYDGTAYGGWQRQPNAPSVQQALEEAFGTVLRRRCSITGAGRTDAGVHARGQGAHIDISRKIDPKTCQRSVNGLLPWDIAIYNLRPVPEDFHARYSAVRRSYRYTFTTRKAPLWHRYAWFMSYAVDWELVRENMRALIGRHDFSAFCSAGSGAEHAVCVVDNVDLEHDGIRWVFSMRANRFVYKMVRSVVGTLIDMGRGKIDGSLCTILESGRRERAGTTAPACGLVLEAVTYPEEGM